MIYDGFFYRDSKRPHIPKAIPADIFKALWRGLKTCHIVRIDYSDDKGQVSHRKVLPEIIFSWSNQWYLAGYCYFRQQERHFRMDRISKAHCSEAKGRPRGALQRPPQHATTRVDIAGYGSDHRYSPSPPTRPAYRRARRTSGILSPERYHCDGYSPGSTASVRTVARARASFIVHSSPSPAARNRQMVRIASRCPPCSAARGAIP